MSGIIGQGLGIARIQIRVMRNLKVRKVSNLDDTPDPYRKDNIPFSASRDGMVRVGNGYRKQNKGVE